MARGAKWIRSHDSWRLRGTEGWRHDSGEAEQRAGEQRHDSGEVGETEVPSGWVVDHLLDSKFIVILSCDFITSWLNLLASN